MSYLLCKDEGSMKTENQNGVLKHWNIGVMGWDGKGAPHQTLYGVHACLDKGQYGAGCVFWVVVWPWGGVVRRGNRSLALAWRKGVHESAMDENALELQRLSWHNVETPNWLLL